MSPTTTAASAAAASTPTASAKAKTTRTRTKTTARPRRRGVVPEVGVVEVPVEDLVQPPGLSYICRQCDVYGYLTVGEVRACWCCGGNDHLARR